MKISDELRDCIRKAFFPTDADVWEANVPFELTERVMAVQGRVSVEDLRTLEELAKIREHVHYMQGKEAGYRLALSGMRMFTEQFLREMGGVADELAAKIIAGDITPMDQKGLPR